MRRKINNLREIARRCAAGETLDEALSRWLASALEEYLSHRCARLDDAFGIKADPGGMPWWLEEAVRTRNAALCNFAALLRPATTSLSALAREVRKQAVRYGGSAWNHDRILSAPPQNYIGKPKEHLWRAFKSGAPMPLCERQLRDILRQ